MNPSWSSTFTDNTRSFADDGARRLNLRSWRQGLAISIVHHRGSYEKPLLQKNSCASGFEAPRSHGAMYLAYGLSMSNKGSQLTTQWKHETKRLMNGKCGDIS